MWEKGIIILNQRWGLFLMRIDYQSKWKVVRLELSEVIRKINEFTNVKSKEHLARVGIDVNDARGTTVSDLRILAKEIGINHDLALQLWDTKNRECMLLATFIDDPKLINEEQIDKWILDVTSWELCDGLMCNAFEKTKFTFKKAIEWADREEEFVKRAAFVIMARYGLKNRKISDKEALTFWNLIVKHALDERNMVKKAVNWALRQLGKKNIEFNKKAIEISEQLAKISSSSTKWIASDALRELKSASVQKRLT